MEYEVELFDSNETISGMIGETPSLQWPWSTEGRSNRPTRWKSTFKKKIHKNFGYIDIY